MAPVGGSEADELVMTLVERALERPESERELYLRNACGSNRALFDEAWTYVEWEKRMQGFLLDPLPSSKENRSPFRPGQVIINRFLIVREVAQGGMGIVWEAIDQKLERRVALKCAKTGFGKQLPPEVRNAREIAHPNVCKIFEIHTASTTDGEIDFISMEFLEGNTLAEQLRTGRIPEKEGRTIARQLCAGLAEAHRNQLVHGDLKPNNVILAKNADGTMRAVITDFGLARRSDAAAGVIGGTPAYMAPELWSNGKPSVASDVYALGVMFWELHYGLAPRDLGVQSSTIAVGERSVWKAPAGRSLWDRIIAHCLQPEPADRFESATAIAVKFAPSRVWRRVLAAAATLALVVASGAITYQRTTAPAEQVRLALLPFLAPEDVAQGTLRATEVQLAKLKSSQHTGYRFISLDKLIRNRVHTPDEARVLVSASHALQASFERRGETVIVHGTVTDLRSGVDVRQWTAEYQPDQTKYISGALAGLVTNALHLPASEAGATVNAAARQDYEAGLAALRRDKTLDEALKRLEKAVAEDPGSALTFAALAEGQWSKLIQTNDSEWLSRFAESVRRAQLRNPDLAQVHRVAGLLKTDEGYYEQAVAFYRRAIELNPGDVDAYRRLAEAYMRYGQNEDALAAFLKAIEIDPKQYRNYRNFGDFYMRRGLYKEAIAQFRKALEFAAGDLLITRHLSEAYLNDGQFASAESTLRDFLGGNEEPAALHSLGIVLMYERRDREAITTFMRALRLGRERPDLWMFLGTAYRRAGLVSNSARAYQHGIQLCEHNLSKNPRDALQRSYLGYLCAERQERERSQAEIQQALQIAPNNADVRWMAAITFEALKQRKDTVAILKNSPSGVLTDLNRWPDLADLGRDSRFTQLLEQKTR